MCIALTRHNPSCDPAVGDDLRDVARDVHEVHAGGHVHRQVDGVGLHERLQATRSYHGRRARQPADRRRNLSFRAQAGSQPVVLSLSFRGAPSRRATRTAGSPADPWPADPERARGDKSLPSATRRAACLHSGRQTNPPVMPPQPALLMAVETAWARARVSAIGDAGPWPFDRSRPRPGRRCDFDTRARHSPRSGHRPGRTGAGGETRAVPARRSASPARLRNGIGLRRVRTRLA